MSECSAEVETTEVVAAPGELDVIPLSRLRPRRGAS